MRQDLGFRPREHERELAAILSELRELEELEPRAVDRVLRKHPKGGSGLFSKSELVRGYRWLTEARGWPSERGFLEALRMKPVRTASGVAPVTVLTKPYPCPGRCIFCPSDVRMPKSYLPDEPGAQRAAQHRFDPYRQTLSRLLTYRHNGHRTDKIELIVLGGTWSFYPESYRIWFVKRCFDALNDWEESEKAVTGYSLERHREDGRDGAPSKSILSPNYRVDGRSMRRTYNQAVREASRRGEIPEGDGESATWDELERAQRRNEIAEARCVGLSLETRPDHLSAPELLEVRRLGATKVQIGYQSLSDEVLRLNRRGHDVAATRRAMRLLRGAGFKIQAHWMPNLFGSSPERDVDDFRRIFEDPALRPDELKIYPCSLIESAELMAYWQDGRWRPYDRSELLDVLTECLRLTPPYCRITRVIRDIPGTDIVTGNKLTNFRELVEKELRRRGYASRDIRAREIREHRLERNGVRLERIEYATSLGREVFLQYVTAGERLAGFLRLLLPAVRAQIEEIAGSAVIREVHVYGLLAGLGERDGGKSQHAGLGRSLIREAERIARRSEYADLAVISSVGTREYYRGLGFRDGEFYQHRRLP